MKFRTLAIHSGHHPQEHLGAVMTPIYQTSTFAFRGVNRPGPFDYSRSGNPTRKVLETCLASLEGGTAGFAFATGMAAETTVLMMFEAGDTVLVHNDLYGGTHRLFESRPARQEDRRPLRGFARAGGFHRRRRSGVDRIADQSAHEPGGSGSRGRHGSPARRYCHLR